MSHENVRHRIRSRVGIPAASLLLASWYATTALGALGDCSQPVSNGTRPVASDCLFILRSAVGQFPCPSLCVCDTNGNASVQASDALICLKNAVGQDVELECGCTTTTTTTTMPGPCELLVNGDFELQVIGSPENGWSFENLGGGAGWNPSGGNPAGFFVLNASGELDTDPMISQTVTGLEIDGDYRVRGDYRSFAPDFGDPKKHDAFAVLADPPPGGGSSVILALPRPSPDATEWTAFRTDFVAEAETVTLSFAAERGGDDSSFELDNLCLERR